MIRFDDILDKVSAAYGEKDTNLLKKAYIFAARAHKGQTRRSGEPYLSHPLEVANMLADMKLDNVTLVAALLHDVLEDTEVTAAEIRENFGAEVADLVDGVTKISRVQEASPEARQAETIRKIILAMIGDLRVIFIKLADRIHNLQTLKFLPEDKQKDIAKETLDIYAPIANRLGMGRIKAELEDLAFRYVDPDEYFRIAAIVDARAPEGRGRARAADGQLEELMRENGIPAEVEGRIKRLYSIHDKMMKRAIDFDQVYDFKALRIITDTVKNCYAALGIIHQKWPPLPHRFRDFIAMPKANLYRALHTTIITEDKQTFEIQIRTHDMHTLAENGIAAHWKYKDQDDARAVKQDKRLEWLREMVDLYTEQKSPREFLKNLKTDLIPEEVYAFTPKGKVVTLPLGGSALDFAFKVHSEIGLHAAGAVINGAEAPLKSILKTGDIVEIRTSPEKMPRAVWLNTAFTSGARHQIKRWLNLQERTGARRWAGRSGNAGPAAPFAARADEGGGSPPPVGRDAELQDQEPGRFLRPHRPRPRRRRREADGQDQPGGRAGAGAARLHPQAEGEARRGGTRGDRGPGRARRARPAGPLLRPDQGRADHRLHHLGKGRHHPRRPLPAGHQGDPQQ